MIHSVSRCCRKIGFLAASWNSTVRSSTLRGLPTAVAYWLMVEVGAAPRSIENTTSSAVKGVPSWNLTLGRSLKRHSVGRDLLPLGGQRGHDAEMLVAVDQLLVDLPFIMLVMDSFCVRVHGLRVAWLAQRGLLRGRWRGGERDDECAAGDQAEHAVHSVGLEVAAVVGSEPAQRAR